ncbi:glycerophosphodiester phosphodiesterase family protein [Chryseolinea sp. H1M3-3]|uniref:glycerophosphodiester phosphodiesterase n=1 Tax=Chryseolinea sp. H1M3-3 TaxID=3034144 RepID=UPI0023EC85D9|nr:glycerophosphodiester phosphodiesterase family protein [Chryseolinea sp. H1M3-3]
MFIKTIFLLIPLLVHSAINFSVQDHEKNYKLIAHRGGVVEDKHAENSIEALQEAMKRNYWMIEVDIRETKDGIAITQHDGDFKRFYNHDRKVGEMTLSEIKKLRSSPGNASPLTFEELVKMCKGNLHLMLDTKEPHSEQFCQQIESVLVKYDMLSNCYVIGSAMSRKYFLGKAKVGNTYENLKAIGSNDKETGNRYFLFEHGNVLNDEKLLWAKKNDVTVVPSINKFHYRDQSTMMDSARLDIVRLKKAGVQEFQIDSEFDRWFN